MSVPDQSSSPTMFDGMRRLISGVSVITANNRKGDRLAMTATSVTSVSAEPPSLLACVNKDARLGQGMEATEYFCVNLLAPKHKQISVNCSTPENGTSRYEHGHWKCDEETGIFYLADSQAVFFCLKKAVYTYGTHDIFVGDVMRTQVAEGEPTVLAYLNGQYVDL